jgi:hypothetical protein
MISDFQVFFFPSCFTIFLKIMMHLCFATCLDVAIQDVTSFVVWGWFELHIQFLYFYNIFICECWTWICVSYSFLEFKHLHIQIFALWDTLGFNYYYFHSLGIYCWNWNLVLKSFVEFEFHIQEILKFLFKRN